MLLTQTVFKLPLKGDSDQPTYLHLSHAPMSLYTAEPAGLEGARLRGRCM